MTHHPRRSTTPGPRRRELAERLRIRNAMLATGRTANPTVELARLGTRINARDKAERLKGSSRVAEPLTYEQRAERYDRQNLRDGRGTRRTIRQQRQLRRLVVTDLEQRTFALDHGWTLPKGRPTMPRLPR